MILSWQPTSVIDFEKLQIDGSESIAWVPLAIVALLILFGVLKYIRLKYIDPED